MASANESVEGTLLRLTAGRNTWKDPVLAVATAPITLSGEQTVDGVALVAGDRCLVAGQASGAANGIYVVTAGAWRRATDLAIDLHARPGMSVRVLDGSNAGLWGLSSPTDGSITLGTTALEWALVVADTTALATTVSGHTTSITALQQPTCTVHTADGALGYAINVLTSAADGMTLPALSATSGKCKSVVVLNETGLPVTVTSNGSDPIVDGTTATTYVIPAAQRTTTFIDRTTTWSPTTGL